MADTISPKYDVEGLKSRARQYEHKAKVLRQIQSEKLKRSEYWDNALNYSTVIISAIVTCLTFFGIKNIHRLFLADVMSFEHLDFSFSIIVLLLLIAAFLQMTLSLREKSLAHLRSIRDLTDFINRLEDILVVKSVSPSECEALLGRLSDRYEAVNSVLPANSDAEWRNAKTTLKAKESGG